MVLSLPKVSEHTRANITDCLLKTKRTTDDLANSKSFFETAHVKGKIQRFT